MRLEARKFDAEIIYTLRNYKNELFTVSSVTDDLLTNYPSRFDSSSKIARSYVHSQFKRLEKLGCIKRNEVKDGNIINYECTSNFDDTILIKSNELNESASLEKIKTLDSPRNQTIERLSIMLQECNVELLSCIGESEEYNRIYESFPALKKPLKEKLKITQEKSAKLVGSIRAIEIAIGIEQKRVR